MNELRQAIRLLLRHAGFTLTAVLTLGLGIGLVATQYSLIDGVLLRPLPFEEAPRIYHVARAGEGGEGAWAPLAIDEFAAQREQQGSFERLAAFRSETYNLVSGREPPQRLWGSAVSSDFFEILRVRPLLGRTFLAGEDRDGQPLRAVLGHALWRDAFGADPGVLGSTVRLNGEQAEIVGVMPEGFTFPTTDSVWVNLRQPPPGLPADPLGGHQGLGLIKPGVDPPAAAADLELAARRFRESRGLPLDEAPRMRVQRIQSAYNGGGTGPLFASMLAMTVFVLLLACVNVANLLFVRAADRMRDLAVRSALGAGRGRIVRQLLIESLLITVLGALVGLVLAGVGVSLLQSQIASRLELASWMRFDLNHRVLGVTMLSAALAGVLAGLVPALRSARVDVGTVLRADGRGSVGRGAGRARRWMVAGQLAFACMAMVMAAMLALSTTRGAARSLAYDPESLLIGRIELQGPAYADAAARSRFYDQLTERVAATPGVVAAAASSRDLVISGVYTPIEIEGVAYPREQDKPGMSLEVVTRDYFKVIDREPLSGRTFGREDTAQSLPVAVVNQSLVKQLFGGRNPIGARIRRSDVESEWATIVGVVADAGMEGVGNTGSGAGWYLLQEQVGWGWLDLLVRAEGDASALVPAVRAAVAAIDPEQPVHTIRTLTERTQRQLAGLQIIGAMAMVFALAALVLAAVGVFGVVAYGAKLRTREFGLRVALGATGAGIVRMMLRQNALLTLVGTAVGVAGGYLLTRPLASVLSDVSASEPLPYLVVAATLMATAAVACWLPARRAGRADPMVALRNE